MIRALLGKELRQHARLFALLGIVLLFGLWLVAGNPLFSRAMGSGFAALRLLLITLLPVAALLLGNALVASEFRHKTQLFIEGLPVPRWQWLAVKHVVMLAALFSVALLMFAGAAWSGWLGEAMTPRFAALLLVRTLGWTWCVGAFFFSLSFLGRYRIAVTMSVLLGLIWVEQGGIVQLGRTAVFALVDDRFAFEREVWPVRALGFTVLWAGALTILGFLLGLVRDATVASLLAEKMSSREKIVITLLVLGGLTAVGVNIENNANREPVHLPGAVAHERDGRVRVEVTSARRGLNAAQDAELQATGARVADVLAEFSRRLGGVALPPVFLVHREDLGTDECESGKLDHAQGALVRADLLDRDGHFWQLARAVLRDELLAKTSGRAEMEPWAWVLDGFVNWWAERNAGEDGGATAGPAIAVARKAAAAVEFSSASFKQWLRVREVAGRDGADALAAAVFRVLAQKQGEDAVWGFAHEAFAKDVPKDVRGWWRDVWDPPEQRLRRSTGLTFAQLAALVQEELRRP